MIPKLVIKMIIKQVMKAVANASDKEIAGDHEDRKVALQKNTHPPQEYIFFKKCMLYLITCVSNSTRNNKKGFGDY